VWWTLAILCDLAAAQPAPAVSSEAQSVIARVRRAAVARDLRALARLLSSDFAAYGKDASSLRTDPEMLANLVKLIDAGCARTGDDADPRILCRAHIGSPGSLFDEARFARERGHWKLAAIWRAD
jgi:hypothetical protein